MLPDPISPDTAHAPPADRALGLELELIELVRQQDEAGPHHPQSRRLQVEIDAVMDQLVQLSWTMAATGR